MPMSKPFALITKPPLDSNVVFSWLPTAVFALFFLLAGSGIWQPLDRAFYDLLLVVRVDTAPLALSPRIFPVDLNDSVESNLGTTMDARQAFENLFKK